MAKKAFTIVQYHANEVAKSDDLIFGEQANISVLESHLQWLLDHSTSSTHIILEGLEGSQTSPLSFNVNFSTGYSFDLLNNLVQANTEVATIAFASPGASDRIDLVEVRALDEDSDTLQRSFIDGSTGSVYLANVATRTIRKMEFQVVQGVVGSGNAPSGTVGWNKVAEVTVRAGSSNIIDSDIVNVTANVLGQANVGWTTDTTVAVKLGTVANALSTINNSINQPVKTGSAVTFASVTTGSLISTGNTTLARNGGQVLVGESSALKSASKMELVGGTQYTLLLASSITDATIKNNRIVGAHYTNSEEPVGMIQASSSSTSTVLQIGGGYSSVNAPVVIDFYTAVDTTTPTGTLAGRISGNQNLLWGTIVDSGPRAVFAKGVGSLPSISGEIVLLVQNNSGTTNASALALIGGNAGSSRLYFGDVDSATAGRVQYDHTDNSMSFWSGNVEKARITAGARLLVNQVTDTGETIQATGAARFTGTSGYIQVGANGTDINYSYAGANYVKATSSGGYFGFLTNGRVAGNENLILNADQTSNFKAKLTVDAGGAQITGTDGNILLQSTGRSIIVGQNVASDAVAITLGLGRTGNGSAYVDLIGDTTYSAYGVRLLRSPGANSGGSLINRGTGAFTFVGTDGANWSFDNSILVNSISEKTASAGVTVNGVPIIAPIFYDIIQPSTDTALSSISIGQTAYQVIRALASLNLYLPSTGTYSYMWLSLTSTGLLSGTSVSSAAGGSALPISFSPESRTWVVYRRLS